MTVPERFCPPSPEATHPHAKSFWASSSPHTSFPQTPVLLRHFCDSPAAGFQGPTLSCPSKPCSIVFPDVNPYWRRAVHLHPEGPPLLSQLKALLPVLESWARTLIVHTPAGLAMMMLALHPACLELLATGLTSPWAPSAGRWTSPLLPPESAHGRSSITIWEGVGGWLPPAV